MKLKKLNYTKNGYSYIVCTEEECYEWGGAAVCDNCGKDMTGDVYLIYILSQAFCPKCFNEWIKRSRRYEEDLELQEENQKKWYSYHGFEITY